MTTYTRAVPFSLLLIGILFSSAPFAEAAVTSPNAAIQPYGYVCPSGGTTVSQGTIPLYEPTSAAQLYKSFRVTVSEMAGNSQAEYNMYQRALQLTDPKYPPTPVPTVSPRWWPIPSSAEAHLNTVLANYSIPAPAGVSSDPSKYCLKVSVTGITYGHPYGGTTSGFSGLTKYAAYITSGYSWVAPSTIPEGGATGCVYVFGPFPGYPACFDVPSLTYQLSYTWQQYGSAVPVQSGAAPYPARTQTPVAAGYFLNTGAYDIDEMTFALAAPQLPPPPTNASASCNASGTNATLSWTAAPGATAYYLRISKPSGSSCPAGFQTAPWESTQCIPNPDWFQGTSVNYPVTPSSNYSLWVYAANGSGYNPTPAGTTFSCADTAPVATLSNNGPIAPNTSATLTYGCINSTSATIQGIGSVTPVSGGTRPTGPLAASTNYQLTCTGPGGSDSKATTVVVANPRPYLKASPDRVNADGTSYLSWSASGLAPSSSCSMTKNGAPFTPGAPGILAADTLGAIATTSSPGVAQSIPSQTVYKLTCGSAVSTAIVNVVPRFEEF